MLWREHPGCGWKPIDKEIMDMIHRSKQTSQQKPGIEVRLHWQEYCRLGNDDIAKWRPLYLWDSTAVWLPACIVLGGKGKDDPEAWRDRQRSYSHHWSRGYRSRGQGSYHLGFSVLVTCRPVTSDKAAMQGSEAKSEPEAKGIQEGAINSVGPEVR